MFVKIFFFKTNRDYNTHNTGPESWGRKKTPQTISPQQHYMSLKIQNK